MAIYEKLIDLDTQFRQLSVPPIIINDIPNLTQEDRNNASSLISTKFDKELISMLPSCKCGETVGEFSNKTICPKCNTIVKPKLDETIEPLLWFRKPNGVEKLLNPIVYIMIKNRLKRSGFDILHWLTDTRYKTTVKQPIIIEKIQAAGIQRGYNYFVNNFDTIMDFLLNHNYFKVKKTKTEDYLKILIEENRRILFSDYIPLPNKSLLVIEKNNLGTYVDPITIDAIDAINLLISIDLNYHDQSSKTKQNRTAKALSLLTDFYERFYKTNLNPKAGLYRRHIYGARTNYSFRAVITSLTGKHKYDEIHVPWGVGLTTFKVHLLNKLLKRGYDANSALGLIYGHIDTYHPLLDSLLQELLNEAPNKSIYCILQRNQLGFLH